MKIYGDTFKCAGRARALRGLHPAKKCSAGACPPNNPNGTGRARALRRLFV